MARSPQRALAITALLGMTTLGVVIPVAPAIADAALAEATPHEGEILDTRPAEIVLIFNEDLLTGVPHTIQVTDPDGNEVTTGEATADGATLTVPMDADLEGTYQVTWQTVSTDSHPISDA
ncbi:MAG: copper resistance protein CopC [Rhodoglobus sp.]